MMHSFVWIDLHLPEYFDRQFSLFKNKHAEGHFSIISSLVKRNNYLTMTILIRKQKFNQFKYSHESDLEFRRLVTAYLVKVSVALRKFWRRSC